MLITFSATVFVSLCAYNKVDKLKFLITTTERDTTVKPTTWQPIRGAESNCLPLAGRTTSNYN